MDESATAGVRENGLHRRRMWWTRCEADHACARSVESQRDVVCVEWRPWIGRGSHGARHVVMLRVERVI
jgi:hypothetical protein